MASISAIFTPRGRPRAVARRIETGPSSCRTRWRFRAQHSLTPADNLLADGDSVRADVRTASPLLYPRQRRGGPHQWGLTLSPSESAAGSSGVATALIVSTLSGKKTTLLGTNISEPEVWVQVSHSLHACRAQADRRSYDRSSSCRLLPVLTSRKSCQRCLARHPRGECRQRVQVLQWR